MRQKELEIERLQQQLESKKSSGSSDSSVDVCAAVELDEDPTTAYAHEVGACQHWALRTYQYACCMLLRQANPECDQIPNKLGEVSLLIGSCSELSW